IGRDALLAERAAGPPRDRVVSLAVDDPAVDLLGNEPVLLDGRWAGYVRAAAYGYTVGGPVGLAQVSHPDGVTAEWLKAGGFTVRTPSGDRPPPPQIPPRPPPTGRPPRPPADRAALRPHPAAHPGPVGGSRPGAVSSALPSRPQRS